MKVKSTLLVLCAALGLSFGLTQTNEVAFQQDFPVSGNGAPQEITFQKFDPLYDSNGQPTRDLVKIKVTPPVASLGSFTMLNDNDVTSTRFIRYAFEGFDIWTGPELARFEQFLGPFEDAGGLRYEPFDNIFPMISVGQYSHGPQNGYGSPFTTIIGAEGVFTLEPGHGTVSRHTTYSFQVIEITDPRILHSVIRRRIEPADATVTWIKQRTFSYQTFMQDGDEYIPYIPIFFRSGTWNPDEPEFFAALRIEYVFSE